MFPEQAGYTQFETLCVCVCVSEGQRVISTVSQDTELVSPPVRRQEQQHVCVPMNFLL